MSSSAESIPVGPCEAKQIREGQVKACLKEVRRAIHDGEWTVAAMEVELLGAELAEILRLDEAEAKAVPWPVKTIRAERLAEGLGVKAGGAPAWSIIRKVHRSGGEGTGMPAKVTVDLSWGRIVYDASEDVEAARLPAPSCQQCHGDGWILTGGTPVHSPDKAWCPDCYPEHWADLPEDD